MTPDTPLLRHPLDAPSAFLPEDLIHAVRRSRGVIVEAVPPLCVLDFDGDLSDELEAHGLASPVPGWPCFHTRMLGLSLDGVSCGVIPRTIGGPYAVLVAEQLVAAGCKVIVGITSAGRVAPSLGLPSIVVADRAVRDEGTSLHYLPASETVPTPTPALSDALAASLRGAGDVHRGLVWTTDASYRETHAQLQRWAEAGVLAVEMQAAGLFAFAAARGAHVGMVALVSNSVDHAGEQFDTGGHAHRMRVLTAVASATRTFLGAGADGAGRLYWDNVYGRKAEGEASWFEPLPSVSLQMIEEAGLTSSTCVLDVGGGDSRLVDHLVGRGLQCVSVLDVSSAALQRARERLGESAAVPQWIHADVTGTWSVAPVDIWHDRAVFHFLTTADERARYRAHLLRFLKPGGSAIIATFGPDGPASCSGLPVARYSPETLLRELGSGFELVSSVRHTHTTPWGTTQAFQYSRLVRRT